MNVPLLTVKSRLSEFIKFAEANEPVFVTKRGRPTVAIISMEEYEKKFKKTKNRTQILYENWKKTCSSNLEGDDPFENVRDKSIVNSDTKNIWDDD